MSVSRHDRRALQIAKLKRIQKTGAPTYQHAHELVAKTAKEFAADFYERAAHDNVFYRFFPDAPSFIETEWHHFIPLAREWLAKMLTMDEYPERMKEDIADALMKDRMLPRPDNAGTKRADIH